LRKAYSAALNNFRAPYQFAARAVVNRAKSALAKQRRDVPEKFDSEVGRKRSAPKT
jgi:hypothetical protein